MRRLRLFASVGPAVASATFAILARGQGTPAQQVGLHDSTANVFVVPPITFEQYELTFIERYTDPSFGTLYRLTKKGSPYVDVFVYPYPDPAAARTPDAAAAVTKGQADDFVSTLPIMRQRGMMDNYIVAFNSPDSVKGSTDWVHGRFVGVPIKRRGQITVSLFYVYALPDELVKVRADLPFEGWNRSEVPGWVRHLVARMYTQPEHRNDAFVGWNLPAKIGTYELFTTSAMRDSTAVYFQYRAPGATDIRVVQRILGSDTVAAPGTAGDTSSAARAQSAVTRYTARIGSGAVEGVSDYKASFANADTVATGNGQVIGYAAGGDLRCGTAACSDLYYAYVLDGRLFTVGARMLKGSGRLGATMDFAHALVDSLAARSH